MINKMVRRRFNYEYTDDSYPVSEPRLHGQSSEKSNEPQGAIDSAQATEIRKPIPTVSYADADVQVDTAASIGIIQQNEGVQASEEQLLSEASEQQAESSPLTNSSPCLASEANDRIESLEHLLELDVSDEGNMDVHRLRNFASSLVSVSNDTTNAVSMRCMDALFMLTGLFRCRHSTRCFRKYVIEWSTW